MGRDVRFFEQDDEGIPLPRKSELPFEDSFEFQKYIFGQNQDPSNVIVSEESFTWQYSPGVILTMADRTVYFHSYSGGAGKRIDKPPELNTVIELSRGFAVWRTPREGERFSVRLFLTEREAENYLVLHNLI